MSVERVEHFINIFADGLHNILFYKIYGVSMLVLWILIAAIFFSLKLKFQHYRMLGHGFSIASGRHDEVYAKGTITSSQSLFTAVSGSAGMGSIAGVAIGIHMGGPGAVFWMVIAAFLCIVLKFSEVLLGHKYRIIEADGTISGGPFIYLKSSLIKYNQPGCAKFLAGVYAVLFLFTALSSANVFQANQITAILSSTSTTIAENKNLFAITLSAIVTLIIIGGIKRVAKVTSLLAPFMTISYVLACLITIIYHYNHLGVAFTAIFTEAFNRHSIAGGIFGAISIAVARLVFTSEAGTGSASIAHSNAKTNFPAKQACVSMVEFLAVALIAIMSGLLIVVTEAYKLDSSYSGVLLTKYAFATVSSKLAFILTFIVPVFGLGVNIAWSYYGASAWRHLFGNKSIALYYILFICAFYFGCLTTNVSLIIKLADSIWLSTTIPNIIVLYLMRNEIRDETSAYLKLLKSKS